MGTLKTLRWTFNNKQRETILLKVIHTHWTRYLAFNQNSLSHSVVVINRIVITLPRLKWHGKKWWGSTESQWPAWAGGAVCGRKWGGPLPVRWFSKAAALRPAMCATRWTNRCLFDSRLAGRLACANTPGRSPAARRPRFAQCSEAPEQEGDLSRCQPRNKKTNDAGLF